MAVLEYRGGTDKELMNGSVTISKHAQAFPDVMKVMLSSRQVVEIGHMRVLPQSINQLCSVAVADA